MAIQDKYVSAYSPLYETRVQINSAYTSKHCDWLFSCSFKSGDDLIYVIFAECELTDFKEKEACRPRTT